LFLCPFDNDDDHGDDDDDDDDNILQRFSGQ